MSARAIDGEWDLRIVTGTGNVDGKLELQLDGDIVRGTWTRLDVPEEPTEAVNGKIGETTVEFAFIVEVEQVRDQVAFVGEVSGAGNEAMMAGTFTTADGTTGEWTARRPTTPR